MYLWKVDNLIVDLKKGLNEMEQLKYLIVYMLLSYIVMYFPVENNIYDYIIITIEISISIITLLVCFIING
jgi:type III secretory pathway component EscV